MRLQRTDNPGIPSELSPLFYLPAVLNFFILIASCLATSFPVTSLCAPRGDLLGGSGCDLAFAESTHAAAWKLAHVAMSWASKHASH